MDLEFLVKPLPVPHHGGGLETQRLGNLIGGLPGGNEPQDGDFLLRQGDFGSGFICCTRKSRHGGVEKD